MSEARVLVGDVLERLRELPAESVQCVVTSPPYWGLRDYGVPGQLGLEPTPEAYVAKMVEVFREVRRVLRDDGTLWLNIGDSYSANPGQRKETDKAGAKQITKRGSTGSPSRCVPGLKPKDLVGIPWRLAFALQADGWYLRSDIIWSKPNPMPESVTDRPTKSHEYVFLLTKNARYYFDADAVRENAGEVKVCGPNSRAYVDRDPSHGTSKQDAIGKRQYVGFNERWDRSEDNAAPSGRNIRTVWTIATEPFPEAHFATYPRALVEPCIKAGTSERGACPECGAGWERVTEKPARGSWNKGEDRLQVGHRKPSGQKLWDSYRPAELIGWSAFCSHAVDPVPCLVLDPFAGSGTTGVVALSLGRSFVGIELNPEYAAMAQRRLQNVSPLLATVATEEEPEAQVLLFPAPADAGEK